MDGPESFHRAVDKALNKFQNGKATSLAERLELEFGLGDDAAKRRTLYARIQKMEERLGEPVRRAVAEARMQAFTARNKGRYFAAAVCKKLAALQLPEGGE